MQMTTAAKAPAQSAAPTEAVRSVRIYEYSDLVYWWAIWFAALVCIVLTRWEGHQVRIGEKEVYVASSPWVGIGFLVVLFTTLIFTHMRARGRDAIILVLACVVIWLLVHISMGWSVIFDQITLVKVHMNLAFYVTVLVVSLAMWLYVTLVHARLTYGVVNPGEVGWRSPLTGQMETYKPLNFHVIKRSDDLIVHKILGLRFLGLGTGEIDVKFDVPGGGSQHHVFKNVWRPDVKVANMEKLISSQNH
jgi:hypothetical protein